MVGSDVERFDAVGMPVLSKTEDIANVRIKFKNGTVANVTASRVSTEPMRKFRVFQTDSYISMDFAPETSINPDLALRYKNNILHCVRQFHYSPSDTQNTIDIVLLLNGIPIAALELKDEFSGQNVDDAIFQYKKDRDPRDPIFAFNQRLLVYFALDLAQIFTTFELNQKWLLLL